MDFRKRGASALQSPPASLWRLAQGKEPLFRLPPASLPLVLHELHELHGASMPFSFAGNAGKGADCRPEGFNLDVRISRVHFNARVPGEEHPQLLGDAFVR